MMPGCYEIAPIIGRRAAWQWAQLVIKPETAGQMAGPPPYPSGRLTGRALISPFRRATGSNFEDETCI